MTKKNNIINFLAQAMWNPVLQTWIKAIDAGVFALWPGLTSSLMRQYLDKSPETDKGHQRVSKTIVHSTKLSNPLACNGMTVQTV